MRTVDARLEIIEDDAVGVRVRKFEVAELRCNQKLGAQVTSARYDLGAEYEPRIGWSLDPFGMSATQAVLHKLGLPP